MDQDHLPSSHHWRNMPRSQKLLTVSLLMFVFIMPVTLGFLGQSQEIRRQAAGELPISVPDPSPTQAVCATPPVCTSGYVLVYGDPQAGSNACPLFTCVPFASPTLPATCAAANRPANRKSDFNNSNFVDLMDYSIMRREFLQNLPGYQADANCDNRVDLMDYSIMSREFLQP